MVRRVCNNTITGCQLALWAWMHSKWMGYVSDEVVFADCLPSFLNSGGWQQLVWPFRSWLVLGIFFLILSLVRLELWWCYCYSAVSKLTKQLLLQAWQETEKGRKMWFVPRPFRKVRIWNDIVQTATRLVNCFMLANFMQHSKKGSYWGQQKGYRKGSESLGLLENVGFLSVSWTFSL